MFDKIVAGGMSVLLTISSLNVMDMQNVKAAVLTLDQAVAELDLPYEEVYGNITLPETIGGDISIEWETSREDIVDVESHINGGYASTPAGTVTRPDKDTEVTMTAILSKDGKTKEKEFSFIVKKAVEQPETEKYLFVHFTGAEKNPDDEQLYFSVSEDGNNWTDLNDNKPVLRSTIGDMGVRDPYILRSAEGDKFYMLATDLSIYNRTNIFGYGSDAWASCLRPGEGSTSMMVWESTDLVNWTDQRLVDVAGPIGDAGNLWAPEAFYDKKTGEYVVFWASCSASTNSKGDVQNIYYAKTRDFYTFTNPVKWIDTESAVLDTTMIQVGDTYYRASAADGQIRLDKSTSIFGNWTVVGTLESIFGNTGYSGNYLEGPELFTYCQKDWLNGSNGQKVPTFGLMCDQFKLKKGYLPFKTTNLSDSTSKSWTVANNVNFGALMKRHGSILTITEEEYNRVKSVFSQEINRVSRNFTEVFPEVENATGDEVDIIADGSFGNRVTVSDWNFTDTGLWYGAGTIVNTTEISGKRAVGASNGGVYQKVNMESGKTYEGTMDVYLTDAPAGSNLGVFASSGANTQWTGAFQSGYDSMKIVGTVTQEIDFTKFNVWQTMKFTFTPTVSGKYFVGLWGGGEGNSTYIANVSCKENSGYNVDSDKIYVSNTKGVTVRTGNSINYYLWEDLLGENYNPNQFVIFSVNKIAKDNQVQIEVIETAEDIPDTENDERVAHFTFDDTINGFAGEKAKATNSGTAILSEDAIRGKALSLTGASNYLTITEVNGKSLLARSHAATISYWSKVNNNNANWAFYLAPNDTAQTYMSEKYIGILEDKGNLITAERYYSENMDRPVMASAVLTKDVWKHVTVVYDKAKTVIYVDGEKVTEQASEVSLFNAIGNNGVFYIGRANWGAGEYFNGLIDEVNVYNYALNDDEVETLYLSYDREGQLNQEAANAVIDKIIAIGTVEFTDACKTRIDNARNAYDALTAEQKNLVSNLYTLTAAENTYQDLLEDYEAEQEVIQAANQAAANVVIVKINAIGTVELTDACKNKIDDARNAYDNLTPAQKALVTNLATLTNAERTYQQLADEKQNQADVNAYTDVVIKIINIGPSITLDLACKERIDAARNAYDNLTDTQKAGVFNLSTLLAAEEKYQQLLDEQAANQSADQLAANSVIVKINDIGTVTLDASCKIKIDIARAAYDGLTEAQKLLVTNLATLTDAEEAYENFVKEEQKQADQAAANAVMAMIDAIGEVSFTDACKTLIDSARDAYDQLSAAQKGLVINLETLVSAERIYQNLVDEEAAKQEANQAAADIVIAKINAIGNVTLSNDCKDKIDEAKAAYDNLTDAQKELVTNLDVLTNAEDAYKKLQEDAEQNNSGNNNTPKQPTGGNGSVVPQPAPQPIVSNVPTPETVLLNNPGLPSGAAEETKGSTFSTLAANVSKSAKTSNKIKWSKVADAHGYIVLGSPCNVKGKKYKLEVLSIISNNGTTTYTHKGLAKATFYKYVVQAYKMVNGKLQIISTSKTMHAATKGAANVSSLKVNKSRVTLKAKKSFTLKVTEKKSSGKLQRHRKVMFESDNTKVATVNGKGKIKAKKKGTCYIYAYAQNGVYKKVKVTVKK